MDDIQRSANSQLQQVHSQDFIIQLNLEHRECEHALRQGLHHALAAGKMLVGAKIAIGHGDWMAYLSEHFEGSDRTARLYMRLHDQRDLLVQNGNVLPISISEATRMIAALKPEREQTKSKQEHSRRFLELTAEQKRDNCSRWWDVLQSHSLMLHAAGWDMTRIAEALAVKEIEVRRAVAPVPPENFDSGIDSTTFDADFRAAYRAGVSVILAGMTITGLSQAKCRAEIEGFPEAITTLNVLEKLHTERRDRLRGSDIALGTPVFCCMIGDARAALGIEPWPERLGIVHRMPLYERELAAMEGAA